MPPKKSSISDIASQLSDGLVRVAARPNLWGYQPHAKQVSFHSSIARERLYIGGNRSGKTVGGCVEDIWWLLGNHPYRETPKPPVRGRIVGVDFDNGIEKILIPEITRWLPPSALIDGSWEKSYSKGTRTLTLANGSFLEFMSYVQDLDKFAGTSRHFVHFDEEPPEPIFTENKMRLLDTGGSSWLTMTPVEGMTWVYDKLYIPGITGTSRMTEVIQVDMTENPHLNQTEIEVFLSGLDPLEKKARKKGEFVTLGGVVFKNFGEKHVIDPVNVDRIMGWQWIASMDHGFNNPTAWLWHAISPEGQVITFHEHFQNEWTVAQHAQEIHKTNKAFRRAPDLYVGDPAIRQRSAISGHSIQIEYINHGIPIALANNDVRSSIDRMNDYLATDHPTIDPQWQITADCPNLIKEMKRYRWKTHASAKLRSKNNPFEEPHKQDDHAVDSARYMMSFMPDLKPFKVDEGQERRMSAIRAADNALNAHVPVDIIRGQIDTNIGASQENTEWTVIDETLGGIW